MGFAELMAEAMEAVYVDTRGWAVLPAADTGALNVAVFSISVGDGANASCWGYDDAGRVICLLTDFDLLPATGDDGPRDAPTGRPGGRSGSV